MFFDILLLSVIVGAGYLGTMLLWRGGRAQRTYGWMLVINLAIALLALASRKTGTDRSISDLLGFVAIAAGVFLIMIPPVLRNVAHWAYRSDRLGFAILLCGLRETLQPGMGAGQERELFQSMVDVRAGRIDEAVLALRERRSEIDDPLVRRRIDDRIVMTFLYGRRWHDAIDVYEDMGGAEGGPTSPGTVAEMVWAYCEAGELEKAAGQVERLEESPLAQEPLFMPLLLRARLVFLAFAGRATAVDAIIAPSGALGPVMPDSVRLFWAGVARLHAGDRSGARERLGEAAKRSGRNKRVRELAEQRLDAVDEPGVAGPHAFPTAVLELADRLAALATAEPEPGTASSAQMASVLRGRAVITLSLVAANVVVMGLAWALTGANDSMSTLVRGGNLLAGVDVGEWWRMPTSMFLHVGLLHLFLNMYGLWVLGRFVEQIFGSTRFFAIYMIAGIVGAVASHLFSAAPVSVGASGAVLGLAGALLAELGLQREHYPRRWRNGLFRILLVLTAANVAIGFAYPAIDQGAHLGGLIAGAVVAACLSPRWKFAATTAARVAYSGIAALCVVAIAYGTFAAVTTSYADTLAKYPAKARAVNDLEVDAPALWVSYGGELLDRTGIYIHFGVASIAASYPLDVRLDGYLQLEQEMSTAQRDFDSVAPAPTPPLALPEPWRSREFTAIKRGPGSDQLFRVVVFGRDVANGAEQWLGVAYFPQELADDLAPVLASVLTSTRPAKR